MSPSKLVATSCLALALATVIAAAEEQSRAEPSSELRYRRVYAPADRMKDWPTGEGKYLPIEAAEFHRLLRSAEAGANADEPLASQVTAAEYEARLAGDHLLVGRAILQVTHRREAATILPIEPLNAAIQNAAWLAPSQDPKAEAQKPFLGSNRDGQQQVLVAKSGKLTFDWSLSGRGDAVEGIAFFCEFPLCPAAVLRLDLPQNLMPAVDKGAVSGGETGADGLRRWRIDLGGNCRFRLRLARPGTTSSRKTPALLRESSMYEFSPRGVDLSLQWNIDAHEEPLEKIIATLDAGLQLAGAKLGDADIPWTTETLAKEAGTRATLTLPEPLEDGRRILHLRALAPLTLDRPCRLLRIHAEGFSWQEGGTALIVPEPLVIEDIQPINCSQTSIDPLDEPRVGENLQFQNYTPDAAIELTMARRRPSARLLSGTSVEIGSGEMTAQVGVNLTTDDPARHTLEADVTKSWIIDSLEADPGDLLGDWSVEGEPGGQRKLVVRLSRAPLAGGSLRLAISARRPRTFIARQWNASELFPLRFTSPAEDKRLAAIQASDSHRLKLIGAERLARPNARDLTGAEKGLFALLPDGLLFEDNAGAAGLRIAVEEKKPVFSADVAVEARVTKNRLQEHWILRCVPESAGVERVIVQLSRSGDVPPVWTLQPDDNDQLSARQWSKEERQAAGLGTAGETWELTLHRQRSAAFEIRGTWETAMDGAQAVCLASLPEAATQRGTLLILGSAADALQIENRRLTPIAPPPCPRDEYSTVQAAFRFDPVYDAASTGEPALTLSPPGNGELPPAWVWSRRVESWYDGRASARHLAVFNLQNNGAARMIIFLPEGVSSSDIQGTWIDNLPVDWQQGPDGGSGAAGDARVRVGSRPVSLPLPAGKRFPAVSIVFLTHGAELASFGALEPPVPKTEFPVLATSWAAWLPPGYEFVGTDRRWQAEPRPEIAYSQRFFGLFGRGRDEGLFNPFDTGEWFALAGDGSQTRGAATETARAGDNLPGFQAADVQGWSLQRVQLSPLEPVAVKYVHKSARRLWAAMVFLLTLAAGYWQGARHPVFFALLAGVFAISTFILPEAYVPLASAAVLGMLACVLLVIVQTNLRTKATETTADRQSVDHSPPSAFSSVAGAGPMGAALLAVAATLFSALNVRAQDAPEKGPSASAFTPDYRIFIPIDADKKPVGTKLYLPEAFYRELYRGAAARKEEAQGWLLGKAVYQGALARQPGAGRLACDVMKAQFDLHVFGRMMQVMLPFHRENVELVPDGATLDGRPIDLRWAPDGSALEFEVPEPGDYRLELQLRPAVRQLGRRGGFEISVPRVAESRLELVLPEEIASVEVPSAVGPVRAENDPPRIMAQLGPANRLAVRWPETLQPGMAEGGIDADQLTWLRVRPGSAVVDERFIIHAPENQVRRLQLAAEGGLRLLPLQGNDAPDVQIRSQSDQRQIITLQWNRTLKSETVLDLSFLVTGASGVGNFHLPQIEMLDTQTDKRWLALSVDPLLEHQSQGVPGLEPVAAEEFLEYWAGALLPPLQAYRIQSGELDWSLSTRPRRPEISALQNLALSYDQSGADVQFDARLTVARGYVFQYQLSAPPRMKVLSVSVRTEDVEQVMRWSQDAGGKITVFLNGPAEGAQQLSLRGIIPLETEKTALPDIRIERCQVQSTTVQIFRRPDVNLELDLADAAVPEEIKSPLLSGAGQGEGVSDRGRPVKTLELPGGGHLEGAVRLTPNRPKIAAMQVTRLHQHGQQWTASADFHVDVIEGVADQFCVEASDQWKGPYSVDPPAPIKIVEIPGETRQIIVQPKAAVRGRYRFTVSGALEVPPGQAPAPPDMLLCRTQDYSRWLALPRQSKGQPISWETRGLVPSALPGELATDQDESDEFTYQVVSQTPRAVLRAQAAQPGSARVNVADIRLAWQADGLCYGAAEFDLLPGGHAFCPLSLPDGYELVHVAIDGRSVAPASLSPGKWKLPLMSERLPQCVEVAFRGVLSQAAGSGPRQFSAPTLGDLPVTQTLWTIAGPPSLVPQYGEGAKAAACAEQQLLRLRSAAAIIALAENLLPSDDAEEVRNWYQSRCRGFLAARVALLDQVAESGDLKSSQRIKREIETIGNEQGEFARRTGLTEILSRETAETPTARLPLYHQRQWPNAAAPPARYVAAGHAPTITIDYRPVEHLGIAGRIGACLCVGIAVFVFVAGVRCGAWMAILKKWPYAAGVVFGLAWWLWLWPSVLGLAMVLVCLIVCRAARRRQTAGSAGS